MKHFRFSDLRAGFVFFFGAIMFYMVGYMEGTWQGLISIPTEERGQPIYIYVFAAAVGGVCGTAMSEHRTLGSTFAHVFLIPAFFMLSYEDVPRVVNMLVFLLHGAFYLFMVKTMAMEQKNGPKLY